MTIGLKRACVLVLLVGTAVAARAHAGDPWVQTEQGAVRGKLINDGQVRAFLGVPFAAPPVGALRWKAPEPAMRWTGTRAASKYGARCAQGRVFEDMVFQDAGESEDCLFLNVYTPARAGRAGKLPVMVWIHGGGFAGGSGDEPRHNGDFLPLQRVVLVTLNYRLGVFGFLVTDELAKEAQGAAGNYGLMDMVQALQWVRANAAAFGGDAGNVTIFGESAGSFAVSQLMASPMARGLFAKAIGQSGAAFPGNLKLSGATVAEASERNRAWMDSIGVASIAALRALSTDQLVQAALRKGDTGFTPVIDGRFLREPEPDTYAAGRQAQVPLLAGWNADEGSFLAAQGMTGAQWKQTAAGLFKERADEFLSLYPGDSDSLALRSAIDFGGDGFIAFATWQWLNAHRSSGNAPVYRYHFELPASPSKFHPGRFAFHSDDIEYVFGTLRTRPGFKVRREDRQLSKVIMSYWSNFAKTGDPNGAGLPVWPQYGPGDTLIHLDDPVSAGPDAQRPRFEFLLKGIPANR